MLIVIATLLVSLTGTSLTPRAPDAELRWVGGTWIATNRNGQITGHVNIRDCSNGTPCGVLVWIDPKSTSQRFDLRNPNQRLRGRPLIGTLILSGFTKQGEIWRGGRVYNPEDGMSFNSSIARGRDGHLRVTGCLGPFCQTKTWRRHVDN